MTGGHDEDMLVKVGSTIGAALGTVAAAVNRTPKVARRKIATAKRGTKRRLSAGARKINRGAKAARRTVTRKLSARKRTRR